jgi:transcriptional regulator with XRE-family HTH domain
MAGRVNHLDDAQTASHRLHAELGNELRNARLERGLRQTDVARSVHTSGSHVSRLERGEIGAVAIADLLRHGAVLGLRLRARFYPVGGGLRDEGQLALLRQLRARIGEAFHWQLEAPLNIPGDLRAFDALLTNRRATIAVEGITRLHDAQAQLRAVSLKQRDGRVDRLVLVVKASHANRRALSTAKDLLATTFPLGTKATLAALSAGEDPGQNGLILL